MKIRNLTLAPAGTALVFSVYEKDPDPKVPADNANIALAAILPNPDGMTGAAYLQLIRDESPQSTNNNSEIPIPYGGIYPVTEGNGISIFPGYVSDNKNELVEYTRVNGQLSKAGAMKLPPNSSATNIVFAPAKKAYLSMTGLDRIAIFNPITTVQKGEIDPSSPGVSDSSPDSSAMLLRDGPLCVGLSQMVGEQAPLQGHPYSDVAIVDTQADKLLKMITDKISGISMPTRPIDRYLIFMGERKDIYISCVGASDMIKGHNAGVLHIKAGETEFDPTYRQTITEADISEEEKTTGLISAIRYVTSGKAYVYISMPSYYKSGEQGHIAIAGLAVEINLYDRFMKKTKGLDLSNGFEVILVLYKGTVLIGNSSTKVKGTYSLGVQTGGVSKEPVLTTVGNPMLCHYLDKQRPMPSMVLINKGSSCRTNRVTISLQPSKKE